MEQSNKIQILPDYIANQIAAGEVVQRPESVIKELVENSLDAGATDIAVLVKNSGKQLIHIVDNGEGFSKQDLELSVKRHATSKIITAEDLEEIRTYGFRGEALSSIASVSNLEIRSKRLNDEHGWKLIVEPMKRETIEPCNTDIGTQVFVKNIFFNVPARRKFLKSDISEFRYISDTMIRFALSRPEIRFTFYDNDTLIFDTQPSDIVKRIENILGKNISSALIPIENEHENIKITGFIGEPLIAKQSKSGQFLFMNGRHIVSKSLGYAVFSAFEHLLEKRSQPFYLINLTLDPKDVDVNVHPQKHEVKFEDERYIYNLINKAVTEGLQGRNLAPALALQGSMVQTPFDKVPSGNDDFILVNKLTGEVVENRERDNSYSGNLQRNDNQSNFSFAPNQRNNFIPNNENKNFKLSAFDVLFGEKEAFDETGQTIQQREFEKPLQMFWQLHKKYIFTQTDRGVMLIDQHAAHERILYERGLKAMNNEYSNTQDLLFPVEIELNSTQKLLLAELKEDLINLGFRFDLNKNDTADILGVPLDVVTGNETRSLLDILEQYEEYEKVRESTRLDNLAASYGCRSAIKSGHYLTQDEMKKLVNDLFECNMPYVCPHGRPIIIEFTLAEFDRRFGRT